MSIREVRPLYRSILDKIEKKTEPGESMVLEKFWELGGGILQFYWSGAVVSKSGVFFCNSNFSDISYMHIEHSKWKKNGTARSGNFSFTMSDMVMGYVEKSGVTQKHPGFRNYSVWSEKKYEDWTLLFSYI